MEVLNELALCSGIGGISLGFERAGLAHAVCHVEWDAYAAGILIKNMGEGHLSPTPVSDDIHTFDGLPWRDTVDLITAGYPCQPFSIAGKRRGTSDPRHLWPEIARIIGEVGPRFVLLENVPGHLSMGFNAVLGTLTTLGFNARWFTLSAAEVGASHKRERLFCWAWSMDADTDRTRLEGGIGRTERGCVETDKLATQPFPRSEDELPIPRTYGSGHGLSNLVDRLRCLGNAVVPQVAEHIGRCIIESLSVSPQSLPRSSSRNREQKQAK